MGLTANVLPFKTVEEDVRKLCEEVIVGKIEAMTQDLCEQAEKSKNDNKNMLQSFDNLAKQLHGISCTWRTQVADMIAGSITEVQEDIAKKNEEIDVKFAELRESIESRTKDVALTSSNQFNQQHELHMQDVSLSCDAQAHVNLVRKAFATGDVDTKAKGPWTLVSASACSERQQEALNVQLNNTQTEDKSALPVKIIKQEGNMCKRRLQQLRHLVNSSLCKSGDGEVRTGVLGSSKGETRAANVNRNTINSPVDAAKLHKMWTLVHVMLHGNSCLRADDDPSELGKPKAIYTDLLEGRTCTNF